MTTTTRSITPVTARRAGFLRDVMSLGGRALRSIPRDVETLIPALIIPVFFFVINVGALQDLTEIPSGAAAEGFDYKAFQIPVAILFAVTGLSRANILVLDIQNGYFDRLALSPVNRLAMLLGFMVADMALAVAMSVPVFVLAFAIGVDFATGLIGIAALLVLTIIWAIVYNGFPYAIALKTGNPAAVNSSFLLFFPFVFLTTVFIPKEAMTGWLSTVATYNPVTYLLDALRSLITVGWDVEALAKGIACIVGVGVVSGTLALTSLIGRTRRK